MIEPKQAELSEYSNLQLKNKVADLEMRMYNLQVAEDALRYTRVELLCELRRRYKDDTKCVHA